MPENKFKIAKAEAGDAKAIWLIRNSRPVRKNSLTGKAIDFKSHKAWFANKYFNRPVNHCFVLKEKKGIIGYCRFDLCKNKYVVSIAVGPSYHGSGFGDRLLSRAVEFVEANKEIIAEIKLKNLQSIKLFQKNGFEIYRQDKEIFHLKLNRQKNSFYKDAVKLYYLLLKQPPRKSQAIIWPQGDRYDRGRKVLELYQRKWAPIIAITGNNALIGENDRAEEKNISVERMASWLIRRGVSQQDIIIDKNSLNTKEQAGNIMNLAKSKKYKSIILVGSAYYQPRAFLTFLKSAAISGWQGRIINQPAVMPWNKVPGGRKKFVWQYFMEEMEKISKYKKDLVNIRQGIKNLTKA
ncbi:MAG: GNAT family N-acetyltransferase [bacterium]|nr:GNAT family N-acetyltransferase [bacterium]